MASALNIYILTRHRDLPTIERFLEAHVNRPASEDRRDEELMMVPLADHHDAEHRFEGMDWEPALTLSHTIKRGLDYPRRAFAVYLESNTNDGAIVAFTSDDQLVLGLSVSDPDASPENEQQARDLLKQMAEQYDSFLGFISVEEPPPLSEREFRAEAGAPLTIAFWQG